MLSSYEQWSNEGTGLIFHTELLGKVIPGVYISFAKLDKWQWQSSSLLLSTNPHKNIFFKKAIFFLKAH